MDELIGYDHAAHREAMSGPGLLYYFQGAPDEEGRCLSFCLWTSRDEAIEASKGKAHTDAIASVNRFYAKYELERFWVWRDDSPEGFDIKDLDAELLD